MNIEDQNYERQVSFNKTLVSVQKTEINRLEHEIATRLIDYFKAKAKAAEQKSDEIADAENALDLANRTQFLSGLCEDLDKARQKFEEKTTQAPII